MRLANKVALITGAGKGIGKATALEFAKEGAKVVVNYSTSKKEAEDVVAEIKKLGSDAIAVKCDVSSEKEVKAMVADTIKKFGKIDILVNNAAIVASKPFSELIADDWEKTLKVNVIGVFLCSQAVVPHMQKQKYGKIINISSVRGLEHCSRTSAYESSASKAAVINFTKTMAKEFAPEINVNCVAPGWVDTERVKKVDAMRATQKSSKQEIENLFNILMQKAFKGELVA